MTPNQWNRNTRGSVVSLLTQAGFSEDSSVINQLECMNFDEPAEPIKPDDHACLAHPDAPHGFNRNASHTAGRYVCDCEGWVPTAQPQSDSVIVPRELLMELRDSANEAGNLSFRQHHIDHHKRLARRADSLLGGEA